MGNMERLLSVWIEDKTQRNSPMSTTTVQGKARSLYYCLQNEQLENFLLLHMTLQFRSFDMFAI